MGLKFGNKILGVGTNEVASREVLVLRWLGFRTTIGERWRLCDSGHQRLIYSDNVLIRGAKRKSHKVSQSSSESELADLPNPET